MVVTSMDAFTELAIEAIAMLQLDIKMMHVCMHNLNLHLQKHIQQELIDKARIYKDFEVKEELMKKEFND